MIDQVKVGVLGGGSWGTALAVLLAKKGYNVTMWSRNKEQVNSMIEHKENRRYLPGISLPENLILTNSINSTIDSSKILLISVPTHSIRNLLEENKSKIGQNQIIVNVAKGIENGSLKRVSEIVKEILPNNNYVMLSGPSHAEEVGLNLPTTVVSASESREAAEYIQDIFMTPNFRVYTNPDVIGVEIGGALKNIIALTAGISDGLGFGDNTKSALMTRGIFEMAKLGMELGACKTTFSGLSGVGDLIVTCTSMHSRNRKAGILIGEGLSPKEATEKIGMVVEGIKTTKSAYLLSKEHNVEMPITEELYNILYKDADVKGSVQRLMGRSKKHEMENINLDK